MEVRLPVGEQTLLEGRSWVIVKWGNSLGEGIGGCGKFGVPYGGSCVGMEWELAWAALGEHVQCSPKAETFHWGCSYLFVLRCHTYNGKSGTNLCLCLSFQAGGLRWTAPL